ncbi:TDP-N-acetylfucosamine:lipid II N-acetylfucosaminyltransferase [Shewanella sp. S-1]|uniref:TDP-N-acetylfucosamine:lipid II N-acetylfucosaminyltransferase n=2 Tax=Shewanella oncorhynchi TaxID=2726434 RepID=A0ABX1KKT5_9GAMM|nr:TDP-N-acetylfucosamine:lipid II N-acetylfucosaminyltransferase [Shewanella oncorhynchi]
MNSQTVMNKKILHIASLDKFIPDFIGIVRQHFSEQPHTILTFGDIEKYPYTQANNTFHFVTFKKFNVLYKLILTLHSHDKIILHGLYMQQLIILLCLMPWLHKKCVWAIWGWDLYYHQFAVKDKRFRIFEFFRRMLISRLGGFITYVDGDYQKAQQWYGAKGVLYEAITYKSNVYSGEELLSSDNIISKINEHGKINLLVGNSADPANNHQHVFEELVKLELDNIDRIYCPLSYGNSEYAEKIKLLGHLMFGDKFYPLMDFMPLTDYNKILDTVAIAFFAHNRQQAMGNIINLVGRGKTVFMRSDTSSFALFTKLGIKVFTLDDLSLTPQSVEVAIGNNKLVREYFSETNLVQQLKKVFS